MKDIILGVLMAIAAVIITKLLDKKKTPKRETSEADVGEYKDAYQAKYLLTRNEWHEYKKLKEYAAAKNLQICPKVRVLDLIEPRKGRKDYMTLINKVKSKHVDFVICDQDLRIKAILELDDNSHDTKSRKERDKFLDTILQSAGYTVLHTRAVTDSTLEEIKPPM